MATNYYLSLLRLLGDIILVNHELELQRVRNFPKYLGYEGLQLVEC